MAYNKQKHIKPKLIQGEVTHTVTSTFNQIHQAINSYPAIDIESIRQHLKNYDERRIKEKDAMTARINELWNEAERDAEEARKWRDQDE